MYIQFRASSCIFFSSSKFYYMFKKSCPIFIACCSLHSNGQDFWDSDDALSWSMLETPLYQLFMITKPNNYQGWSHRSSNINIFLVFFRSEAPLGTCLSFTYVITQSVTISEMGVTVFVLLKTEKSSDCQLVYLSVSFSNCLSITLFLWTLNKNYV